MITFLLDAPEPWGSNLRTAAAAWPAAVSVGDGAQPASNGRRTVRASLRDPTHRVALDAGPGAETGAGSVRAFISSREPLAPARFGSWVRRCVTRLPDGAALSWPTHDESTVIELPCGPSAVRTTRSHVTRMFADSPRLDDIVLAASELAANAVQHGAGATSLVITTGGAGAGGAVIEIGDRSVDAGPVVLPLLATRSSGRGVAIVDLISDCWGVIALTTEKIVWCQFFDAELSRTAATTRRC